MTWEQFRSIQKRREFLTKLGGGIGIAALADLLGADRLAAASVASTTPLAPKKPHFTPTAKHMICMFMEGGPSQFELFDPKPGMQKWDGQPLPPSMTKDLKLAFIKPTAAVMASPFQFRPHGKCGMEISELIPNIGSCADDITLIRSMHTDAFNHHPGQLLLFTGSIQFGRPSMGSWAIYGLGSESQDLPGFVVLTSGRGTSGGASNFGSGFLPSHYQGTVFRNSGEPIPYLSNPSGISKDMQRETLRTVNALNAEAYADSGDVEIASRMSSYELAFRMQMSSPELLDFSNEPASILEMYGVNSADKDQKQFATNCLLARRLVERGVRYVMLMDASWDHHSEIKKELPKRCRKIDQATAALVKDLKQRGLLAETLLCWGGEFGRTPMVEMRRPGQADSAGRDHHPNAYSMWLAGGGIKSGLVHGKTDDLCLNIVESPVHVHDLQATIMRCLGFDHTRLTYRHMGRDFRLTDVDGTVVKDILA